MFAQINRDLLFRQVQIRQESDIRYQRVKQQIHLRLTSVMNRCYDVLAETEQAGLFGLGRGNRYMLDTGWGASCWLYESFPLFFFL